MKMRYLSFLAAALITTVLMGCSALGSQGQAQPGAAQPATQPVQTTLADTITMNQSTPSGQAQPSEPGETAEPARPTESSEMAEPTKAPEQGESTGQGGTTGQPAMQATLPPQAAIPATGSTVTLDQILNYHVVDASGVPLGDVKDAVINSGGANAAAGQITYLIVNSNTREDWYIPVPWKNVQVRSDMQTVVLPVNAAQLNAAPGFNKDAWPGSFAATQTFWANPGQASGMGAQMAPGIASGYVRAKDLLDLKVVSQQGLKLGKIKDVAIDWQNSAPSSAAAQFGYVVMELDDNLGAKNLMIPVPWRLVHPTPGQETLVLNFNPTQLQSAPNFLKDSAVNLYSGPLSQQLQSFWQNR